MRLYELFADPPLDMEGKLSNLLAQALAPLAAAGVPSVNVNAVIDRLQAAHTGVQINRAAVMQLCDPTKMQFVKSIDGDNLVLTEPSIDRAADQETEEEKNKAKIAAGAEKQAQAEVKKKSDKPAAPPPSPKKVSGSPL